jgi:hypothetical protein
MRFLGRSVVVRSLCYSWFLWNKVRFRFRNGWVTRWGVTIHNLGFRWKSLALRTGGRRRLRCIALKVRFVRVEFWLVPVCPERWKARSVRLVDGRSLKWIWKWKRRLDLRISCWKLLWFGGFGRCLGTQPSSNALWIFKLMCWIRRVFKQVGQLFIRIANPRFQ